MYNIHRYKKSIINVILYPLVLYFIDPKKKHYIQKRTHQYSGVVILVNINWKILGQISVHDNYPRYDTDRILS